MLFSDSETQKLLRDTTRSFLRDRYPWGRLYALERGEAQLSAGDLKEFAELGWLGLIAPESAGGAGASLVDGAVVIEEFGYAGVPAPISVANIAAYLLALAPSPENVRHSLEITDGSRLYTIAEANRWTVDGSAAPSSNGGWLNGSLRLVPFGIMADYVIAPLSSDGEPAIAIVPIAAARRERVRVLDRSDYCDITFEDALADGVTLLSEGPIAEKMRSRLDALSTAFGLIELAGLMQRVTDMTSEYISNRVQFGQPIAKFQAVRHHAADMLMQTQTLRWAAYHALDCFEKDPADTAEIWLAKHWAVRASQAVFELTHLLHGGVGVGTEYPLHLLTQGVAAWAVRAGDMNEMVGRINGSLGVAGGGTAVSA